MKLWKWTTGRQDGIEYYKLPLFSFKMLKYGFDAYILDYKKEGSLPRHTDPVKNGEHYRLNIRLKGDSVFFLQGKVVHKRFVCFRPDKQIHSLWVKTPTIKLSFGFVKFK